MTMLDESTDCGYGANSGTSQPPFLPARRSCGGLPRWHVVATVPGRAIVAEAALSADGWRVYHPLHLQRTAGHPSRIVSLFSNYMFVFVDTSDCDWPRINRTRFVAGLLPAPARPAPVPLGVVEQLQARTSARRIVDDPLSPEAWQHISLGASVSVVEGPLAGLLGSVTRLSARNRCSVLLSLLGRECVMDLPAQALAVA
jgi:transcription antitermination factor NusG